MRLLDQFPGDAARGGDFRTRSGTPNRQFVPLCQDQWGTRYRNERVLATGVWIEELPNPVGEVCFLESTIRDFGELIGLVPVEQVRDRDREIAHLQGLIVKMEAELHDAQLVEVVARRAVQDAVNQTFNEMGIPLPGEHADGHANGESAPAEPDEVIEANAAATVAALAVPEPALPPGSAPPPSDAELGLVKKARRR